MLFRRVSRSLVPIPLVFFFFKQKSAYEMRISDWSSDVCSSDLGPVTGADVFRTMYCETEPMPFLGDVMLWAILAAMNRAERPPFAVDPARSEEHTSELQSLMRISYAVFCLKKQITHLSIH